jgi:hypothetical protein
MKKYFFIIVILLSMYYLKAQDSQPDAFYFKYYINNNQTIKQIDVSDFPQNHFIMGWQWGGHPNMTAALKMNMSENHEGSWGSLSPNNSGSPINYIWQMRVWNKGDVPHLCAISFIYKPTLTFDENMNVINPIDPEHNIFGFRVKDNNTTNS